MLSNTSVSASNVLGNAGTTGNTMVLNAQLDEKADKSLQECRLIQCMIDASCDHLHKLRAPTLSKNGIFTQPSGNVSSSKLRNV